MNSRQTRAVNEHEDDLRERLEPSVDQLLAFAVTKKVISQGEQETIRATPQSKNRMTDLLSKLKSKENGFSVIVSFLRNHDCTAFANTLENEVGQSAQYANGRKLALWEVPFRNRFFTGRETLIDQLLKSFEPFTFSFLSNPPSSQVVLNTTILLACHGLGGVGKTQLAIEFVHRHKESFYDVFWFSAEDSNQIEMAYKKLAKEFQIDMQQPINDIVSEIKGWFGAHPGCLLIDDNASNSDMIEEYMPKKGCCVLITSRNISKWYKYPNGYDIAVDVFEIHEATDYIERILVDEVEKAKVQELAERSGCLPLALAQACAYMKEKEVTISDYLHLYEEKQKRLLSENILPQKEHEPVFLTWNITMNAIEVESPLAANLLKICSYFHSDDIPHFLLRPFTENTTINCKGQIFEDACGILKKYSMINVNKAQHTISLHRILQEVVRLKLKKINNRKFFREAQIAVLEAYPHGETLADYKKKPR